MSARQSHRTIHPHSVNVENTAQLLQTIAKELYEKNLEIRKEQTRLDELLSRVAEVIFAVDQDYKITLFNSAAEASFNISEDKAVGANANEIIKLLDGKEDKPIVIEDYAFKNKLHVIPKVRIKITNPKNNESTLERYFALKSNYVDFDGHFKEAIISLADITREVEIEKLKDDFISIASHELKTPMSIIKNNLWMLTNTTGIKFDDRGQRYVNEMNQGLSRLKALVEELLGVSRIEQDRIVIDLKEWDADQLVNESLDNFIETFKLKKIEVTLPQKTDAKVMIDKIKFQEVIDNFVSNGIKYTNPETPKLIIKTETTQDGYFRFSVTDNGPGIAKSDYSKIFTKFGRATEGLKLVSPGASTGLGLYIAKNYIKGMQGKIGFSSELGKGSEFWFMVPLSKKQIETINKSE